MKRSNLFVVSSLILLFVLARCAGESGVNPDTGSAADRSSADNTPGPDAKQPTPDVKKPNPDAKQPTPDVKQPTPDAKPKPDSKVPKPDSKAPKPDGPSGACGGVKCVLQNDCCFCKGRKTGTTVPVCPSTTCKQPTCGGIMIKSPLTYCINGRCLVTDGPTTCTSDSDCRLVNNCCDCLALPTKALNPPCAVTSCFVPSCTAFGLNAYKPRCVSGVCKLQ